MRAVSLAARAPDRSVCTGASRARRSRRLATWFKERLDAMLSKGACRATTGASSVLIAVPKGWDQADCQAAAGSRSSVVRRHLLRIQKC